MDADRRSLITLSSDFGWPYPAAMRGVIAARTDARLIDVTHDLPRGDVRTGAFWLREVLPYFPASTHLAVVDPGVGTDRAVLVVHAGQHVLVAPDNGLVRPVASRLADDDPSVYELRDYDAASATFHGRDVFAPLAARVHDHGIAALVERDELEPCPAPVDLRFPTATLEDDRARGEVLVVDVFGNAITNVPGEFIEPAMGGTVSVDGTTVPVARSYGHVAPGEALVTVGSHGNVELAENDGRGSDAFGIDAGDAVSLAR